MPAGSFDGDRRKDSGAHRQRVSRRRGRFQGAGARRDGGGNWAAAYLGTGFVWAGGRGDGRRDFAARITGDHGADGRGVDRADSARFARAARVAQRLFAVWGLQFYVRPDVTSGYKTTQRRVTVPLESNRHPPRRARRQSDEGVEEHERRWAQRG